MESLKYSLRPLNWDLSLCGCPIFSYKWKLVNYLLKVHGILLVIIFIFIQVSETAVIGIKHRSFIVFCMIIFWELVCFGYCISFIGIILSSNERLVFLLKQMSINLTPKDHEKILGFSTKMLIHKLLATVLMRVIFVAYGVWNNSYEKEGIKLDQIMLVCYQVHDPYVGTLSLYLTLLKVLHLAESNIITDLENNMLQYSPRVVYYKIRECVQFKNNFSKLVSIFVCIMFSYLFIHAVCSICRLQVTYLNDQTLTQEKVLALLSLIRLFIYFLQAVFLVFMTQKFSQESQDKLASLADTIVLLRDTHQWFFVLEEIKVAQGYRYRAYDFFDVDKNFLLSFVSSFVPLTVLFIQLINP